ncbi:VOC family protein [Daejeonella oryzae]|uniref:VOC family protein n=1 Tax=Daejeonella oryzae TaxID=1122943 RepID=UPI00040C4B15|nr:VOC family protein [Daejeonella oryzae]
MNLSGKLKIMLLILALGTAANGASAQNINKPSLNHIALYVQNLQVSTEFYRDIVGLDTIPEPFKDGKHTWFTLGIAGQLHLISGSGESQVHNKNSHLCFSVNSIESFISKLDSNKIEYINWKGDSKSPTIRVDGVMQIYFQDPNGYWIEVNNDR